MLRRAFCIQRVMACTILALMLAMPLAPADAGAIRPGFDTTTQPGNDDGSDGPVAIGFTANFFGLSFTSLYVNTNGNVTFDSSLSTFTPFNLTSTSRQIIAPFFADVDTRAGNQVTYGTGLVDGRNAFGVNWIDVGYFSHRTDKLNSFQLVLIDRSDIAPGDFDIEFNYDKIQWETGEASGGTDGLGGDSARAGYSNGTGDPDTFFELPGSAVNGAFIDGGPNALVSHSLNSNVLGRYLFTARSGQIVTPPPAPSTVPEPMSMALFGFGLLTAAGLTMHRRKKDAA